MALPTLRMPMYRSSGRDESLLTAHSSRHAEYMADGNSSFRNERRQQRAVQQQIGGVDFRSNRPSISRNGSSSRGSSIVNYGRFNDNYNESHDMSPRGGGQRLTEMNGGDRARHDLMPTKPVMRESSMYMGGSMSDLPRNRMRNNAFENPRLDPPLTLHGYQDQRFGNNPGIPRFKSMLNNGPSLFSRKNLNKNRDPLAFTTTRKLEGCNTLKDGRDIEAIAPAPAQIKVFDRHGRELTTGGELMPVPPPLQQNFAALRGRTAAREEHRPLQRRQNYHHQTSAQMPYLGGRQNRYQNAYDGSQSLLPGSQQAPAIPPYKRPPMHAKREGANELMDMYDDDFGGSTTFFSSTGSNSPSGPSATSSNNNSYYSGARKRRLSPPVDLLPALSGREYRGGSSVVSPSEKRKRTTFPSITSTAAGEGDARKTSDQQVDASNDLLDKGKPTGNYHYKKCKLLGRVCNTAIYVPLASYGPPSSSLPMTDNDSKSQADEAEVGSVPAADVPTATAAVDSSKDAGVVCTQKKSNIDVVVDKVKTVPVSTSTLAVEVSAVACHHTGRQEHIAYCPCILRNGDNIRSAVKQCCLNTASASTVGKFLQFKAFQETRDRCKALLTGTISARYDDAALVAAGEVFSAVQSITNIEQQMSSPASSSTVEVRADNITKTTVSASDVVVEVAVVSTAGKDEDRYEVEHAAFTRRLFAEHFSRLDMLAKLISHAEQWRHMVMRPLKTDSTSMSSEPKVSQIDKGKTMPASAVTISDGTELPQVTPSVDPVNETTAKPSPLDTNEAVICCKQQLLMDSPLVSACPHLRAAVEAGKFRAVLRYLKQFYSAMLNNLETTGLYQRALRGYQQRKREKIAANGSSEEPSLPKRLLLARSMGTFRRMLTNYRRLTVEKRADYFLRCARDCSRLPVYVNVGDALALAATPVDVVVSGAVYEKPSSRSNDRASVTSSSMRDEVHERIKKQLQTGIMMDKVFEQIQKSKREKLLRARSDLCDNPTFLKGLDIVTQTFDKVNQRMSWNEELDLLLGYDEIEEKMLRECQAPLNSYERRSKLKALADDKFRNIETVDFVLNMNNVPPPVNPYKPLRPPKVCASTKSFFAQYAAYRVEKPREEFDACVTTCTTRWTQPQVEGFFKSYREHPKYWLEIGRNLSLTNPNDAVMLYRMLKLSTYEYRLLHNLGGSLLTDADFAGDAENDSERNNAGLSRHARPPFSSLVGAGRKTPMFSFFHSTNSRQNIIISNGAGSKRPRAFDETNAAAETMTLLTYPNKLLKADNAKLPWKDGRTVAAESSSFFSVNTPVSSATTTTACSSSVKKPNTVYNASPSLATSEVTAKTLCGVTEEASCSSGKPTEVSSNNKNSVLSRWSFDLSALLARIGVCWYQLSVNKNPQINEEFDNKWKALGRREKSDMALLKRERAKALKTAKKEAARKNGRGNNRTSTAATTTTITATTATTSASSPTVVEMDDENSIVEAGMGENAETIDRLAVIKEGALLEVAEMRTPTRNDDFRGTGKGDFVADAATSLITAAAVDALLDLAQAETIAPLTTLPSLPMVMMMTTAELDAVRTPSSEPTTPLNSPPPGMYRFGSTSETDITKPAEPGTPPMSTTSLVVPTTPTETPPSLAAAAAIVVRKKRGRRRAADVAAANINSNAASSNNVRISTSASIVAAGAGCGIAKSSTKTVRAAKRTALAAFDNNNGGGGGRTSNNSAAAICQSELLAAAEQASDNTAVNSIETYLANQVLAGLACASATSPPSETISSAEDDSMPALTPDVDRISRAIEREQKAAAASVASRRNCLSQQPLPVKSNLKSSSSTSSLMMTALPTKNSFFGSDTNAGFVAQLPQEVVEKCKVKTKMSRQCSLTPPSATNSDVNSTTNVAALPESTVTGPPPLAARITPQRRMPLPTKADRLLESTCLPSQLPLRSSLMPPHAALPVKSGSVTSTDSTTLSEEKLKSQLVLVKGGGRKKLTGNQVVAAGSKSKKSLVIASSLESNVTVQVAEAAASLPPLASCVPMVAPAQSQPQVPQVLPVSLTTPATPTVNNNESSNFFRSSRQAVPSGGSGRAVYPQAVGTVNGDKPAGRGVDVNDDLRKPTDAGVPSPSSWIPPPKLAPSSSSSSLLPARSPITQSQQQQQPPTSTFTGSRFVSQTSQQQVTFGGGGKSVVKLNAVTVPPKTTTFPAIAASNNKQAQFFARSKRFHNGAVDNTGNKRSDSNTHVDSTVFGGGANSRFLSVQHHLHQQHLLQQHSQRTRNAAAAGQADAVNSGNSVVFRSSIMMGDRKKRSDMPSPPSSSSQSGQNSNNNTMSAFSRNNKLSVGQAALFPSSKINGTSASTTVTAKTADSLIDDVLNDYKRSNRRIKTRRGIATGATTNGGGADEGEFYENISEASS